MLECMPMILSSSKINAQGSPQNTLNPDNLANVFGVKADIYQNCQNPQDKIIFPVALTK